eukprot:TRINITY_DN2660_c0_g2_i1.p1 TRINITY_DN2660_c0_g2~~TRINITY_DN2660_c0_g2_i1.p1  ORF type:complete len:399 (-),score=118.02 TRINITY_DN2660_c0_g2_i1:4-1200(-)
MRRKDGSSLSSTEEPSPAERSESPSLLDKFSSFMGSISLFQRSQDEIDRSISRALQPPEEAPSPERPDSPNAVELAWKKITSIFDSDSDTEDQSDDSKRLRRQEREQRRERADSHKALVKSQEKAQEFLNEEFDQHDGGVGSPHSPIAVEQQKSHLDDAEAARLRAEEQVRALSASAEKKAKEKRARYKAEQAALAAVDVQAAEEAKVLISAAKQAAALELAREIEEIQQATAAEQELVSEQQLAEADAAKHAAAKDAAAKALEQALAEQPPMALSRRLKSRRQAPRGVPQLDLPSEGSKSRAEQVEVLFEALTEQADTVRAAQLLFLLQSLDPGLSEEEAAEALLGIGAEKRTDELDQTQFNAWVEFLFDEEDEDEFEQTFDILLEAALAHSVDHKG